MTQPSDTEDSQWLDALAGKPDPNAGPEVNLEGAALRSALRERTKVIDREVPNADSSLYARLMTRLEREGLRNRGKTFSWKALVIYLLTAFAIGSAATRMMMLSTVPATRSGGSVVDVQGTYAQQVAIKVADPAQTAQAAVGEAVKAGLVVAAEADASGYRVVIDGFVPYSPDQEALRTVLGLDKSASGKLLFTITKRAGQ